MIQCVRLVQHPDFDCHGDRCVGHGGKFEEDKTSSILTDTHNTTALSKVMHGLQFVGSALTAPIAGLMKLFGRNKTPNPNSLVDPNAKSGWMKGARNYGGQQGHMLFTHKSKGGPENNDVQSNVNMAIESNAPEYQNLTGHMHDMRARSEAEGVFGQSKFKNMSKHGLISKEQQALLPEGHDSMRAQIKDRKKWRHVQDVAKTLGSVKTKQQKKLYKQVLPSKPAEAKEIFEKRYQEILKSRKGQTEGIGALDSYWILWICMF